MPLIRACVEELRRLHGSELDILVYYEDQPVNDFTSLFSYVQGIHIINYQNNTVTITKIYTNLCGLS